MAFKVESGKFDQMYDFHAAPHHADSVIDGGIVFGRKDLRIAQAAADLLVARTLPWVVVTGGIGKDSGDLPVPEAVYLGSHIVGERGIPQSRVHLETKATNGGENVRFSYSMIAELGLGHSEMAAVAHGTSLRRLGRMMLNQSQIDHFGVEAVYRYPSAYPFDATNPVDQKEAVGELLRLADWPNKVDTDGKPWLSLDPEIDRPDIQELVAYARAADIFWKETA